MGYSNSPIEAAVNAEDMNILNLVIALGAKPEKYPFSSISWHNRWIYNRNKQAIVLLLQKSQFSQKELDWLLVELSYEKAYVDALIEKGAQLNAARFDMHGPLQTALGNAAYYGDQDAINYLLAKGALVNLEGNLGNSPLLSAVSASKPDAVKVLLQAGADINKYNNCGFSPLLMAAANHEAGLVKILIDSGADPDIRDRRKGVSSRCKEVDAMEFGNNAGPINGTALMWAAFSTDRISVQNLIKAGANLNLTDEEGISARQWMQRSDLRISERSQVMIKLREQERIAKFKKKPPNEKAQP